MSIEALLGFFGRAGITAIVVVLASVIAEASGPVIGALAASLPVSAGPTYVFLALAHNTSFVSASALGSFAANAATIVFLATYARITIGRTRLAALIPAILAWLLMALLIQSIPWASWSALVLNAGIAVFGRTLGELIAERLACPFPSSRIAGTRPRPCYSSGATLAARSPSIVQSTTRATYASRSPNGNAGKVRTAATAPCTAVHSSVVMA